MHTLGLIRDNLLRTLPYIFVFIASLSYPADLDLGWHLKYGEYFFKTGKILRENIFSTEMPLYQYINHAWATDILTFSVFQQFGFVGLSIASALIVMGTFYFFARAARLSLWEEAFIFPAILYASYYSIGLSFRSQLISLAFLGALYFMISTYEERKSTLTLFYIPPLFLVWANMHGGFILGLFVLSIWCVISLSETLFIIYKKNKQFEWKMLDIQVVGMVAFLITLINPFGWKLYEEAFRHIGSSLQKFVIEWSPISQNQFLFNAYIVSGIFLVFGIVFFYKNHRKVELLHFAIPAVIFWIFAFQQRRYFVSTLFVAMPFFGAIASSLKPSNKKTAFYISSFVVLCLYVFSAFYLLPQRNIFRMDWIYYCRINGCSQYSAEYLVKNKLPGAMFSDYNWGGWLIWNYPEVKPTIDGRMPFWKDNLGYSAFDKYIKLENNLIDIDNSEYDIVYISPTKKTIFDRLQQLVSEGKWRVAYHDLFAYIFVRNK